MENGRFTVLRIVTVLLVAISCIAFIGGCRKVIRSDVRKLVPFSITTEPPGATVKVSITIENYEEEGVQREFTVTTPFTEGPGLEGLIKFVVIDGEQNRQAWDITVTKQGFKTIKKTEYSPNISQTLHFILEPDIGED